MRRFYLVLLAATALGVAACTSAPQNEVEPEPSTQSGGSYTVLDLESQDQQSAMQGSEEAEEMDLLGIWRLVTITDGDGVVLPPFDEHAPLMQPAVEFDTIGGVTVKVGCSLIEGSIDENYRFTLGDAEPLFGCPGEDKPTEDALVGLLSDAVLVSVTSDDELLISTEGNAEVGRFEREVWTDEDMENV